MNWAIVTPSYKLDFERCKLLCESIDAFVTGDWHHYIIVGKVDLKLFAGLSGPRRTVLLKENILPNWLRYIGRIPKLHGGELFFSWRTGPMFGWHVQQIIKLSMAHYLKEQAMMFCDSDIFFVRPVRLSGLEKNGTVPFFRSTNSAERGSKSIPAFGLNSKQSLGLQNREITEYDYVENLIAWHRQTAVDMCNYLEQLHRKNWISAIYGYRLLSEYTLYGLYVDYILKDKSGFEIQDYCMCKTVHYGPAFDGAKLDAFFASLSPRQVAVGFQSTIGFNMESLRQQFAKAVKYQAGPFPVP